jgi:hypothetical protein
VTHPEWRERERETARLLVSEEEVRLEMGVGERLPAVIIMADSGQALSPALFD